MPTPIITKQQVATTVTPTHSNGDNMPNIQALTSEVDRLNAAVASWNRWIIGFMICAAVSACALVIAQRFSFRRGIEAAIAQDALNEAKESAVKLLLAQQPERAATAEGKLLSLQQKIAPRKLDDDQVAKLLGVLSREPKGEVFVSTPLGDGESTAFAKSIEGVLRGQGWSKQPVAGVVWTDAEPIGTKIIIQDDKAVPAYVTRLQNAFFLAGIPLTVKVVPEGEHGKVYLVVGHKP